MLAMRRAPGGAVSNRFFHNMSTCPRCGTTLVSGDGDHCPRCLADALFGEATAVPMRGPPRPSLGDYELLEEIARGGMGVVYRARQISLGREVAVKLMRERTLADGEEVRRFRVEAAAAARLKHPHIVAIHEIGEHEGQHYFAMDLVEGADLARHTRAGPMPAAEAARITATIAEAVQHAHEKGVLHRDLKPSNVLLDGQGQPFVTDFGLARSLDADSSLTVTGQVLGTPGYMPPEQAMGRGTVGPAADIYSLGAVLYHLLTGRAPFAGGTPAETMRHVVEQEPVSPQLLNPGVPRDLVSVCLKCLNKRPSDRYATAADLAEDLRRFLGGEPTLARPAGQTERLWRWCQRKPAIAALTVAVCLLVLLFAIGSPIVAYRMNLAREAAENLRSRAEASEGVARQRLYAADMNLAVQALEDNDLGRALALTERHRPGLAEPDIRGWEWRYLRYRCQSDALGAIGYHSNMVASVFFTPDARALVTAGQDGLLKFWEPGTWRLLGQFAPTNGVRSAALSPDGRTLAVAGLRSDTVTLWEYPALRPLFGDAALASRPGWFHAFAPDSRSVAIATEAGSIEVVELASGRTMRRLGTEQVTLSTLVFSMDGNRLASGSMDVSGVRSNMLTLWDTSSWQVTGSFNPHPFLITALEFAPDGGAIASSGFQPSVRLWDTETREKLASYYGHSTHCTTLRFSPDGRFLASAGADQLIIIWDRATKKVTARLKGHAEEVTALAYSFDGKTLVSGGKDGSILFWSAEMSPDENEFIPAPRGVAGGAFSRDGRFGLLELGDRVEVWTSTGRMVQTLPRVRCAIAPKSEWIALADREGLMTVLAVTNFQKIASLPSGQTNIGILAFPPDPRTLITVSGGQVVTRWDWAKGERLGGWTVSSKISALAFPPKGPEVALGFDDGQVEIWDFSTGMRLAKVAGHRGMVHDLKYSRDGRWLVSGAHDSTARLWDLRTRTELARLKGHKQAVFTVEFSMDDSRIATAGADGTIKLWDRITHQEVLSLKGHIHNIAMAFLEDGRTLVSASDDGQRHWYAPGLQEIEREERSGKNSTTSR